MATAIILILLAIVLALIFIGARVGGIGLGIYGMVGVFILVFFFGLKPGNLPIDVMLIIVSVITAAAALQATGGLDYLAGLAAKFLRKHPNHITYFGPLTTWLFCIVAGTAHTSYSLLPIISESLIPDSRFHYYHRVYRNRLLNHSVPISPNVICGNGLYRTFSSTIEVPM